MGLRKTLGASKVQLRGQFIQESVLLALAALFLAFAFSIFLVPASTKQILVDYLKDIRKVLHYDKPICFGNIGGRGRIYKCSEAWVLFAYAAMMQKIKRDEFPYIKLPKLDKGQLTWGRYNKLPIGKNIVGCKFIVSRVRDSFLGMYDTLDYGAKVEITFSAYARLTFGQFNFGIQQNSAFSCFNLKDIIDVFKNFSL